MTTAYFSTVLDHPVDKVWSLLRDFNNYPVYIEGVTESVIEDGKPGDEVGAVRKFCYGGHWLRQRLIDHSDERLTFSYAGLERFAFPAEADPQPSPVQYQGTIKLSPVVADGRTFIEWSVAFDSQPNDKSAWHGLLMTLIPEWTASLRRTLERRAN